MFDKDIENRCPRCSSRHAVSLCRIRTGVRRAGKYVSLDTGDHMRCEKCGHEFASTDEGVFEYPAQPQYPQNVTSTQEPRPDPLPVVRLKPRERKATV